MHGAPAYNSLFVLTTERIKQGSRTRRRRSQEKEHWLRHPILATWPQAPKHSREGGIPQSSSIEDPRPNIRGRLGGYRVGVLTAGPACCSSRPVTRPRRLDQARRSTLAR